MDNPFEAPAEEVAFDSAELGLRADARFRDLLLQGITLSGPVLLLWLGGSFEPQTLLVWLVLQITKAGMLAADGSTPAKYMRGVRVVRTDGSRASLGRLLAREWLGVPLTMGWLVVQWLRLRLGWPIRPLGALPHDLFFDTRVVRRA
jgi:uncharacterized RDD family membrane protein YckC